MEALKRGCGPGENMNNIVLVIRKVLSVSFLFIRHGSKPASVQISYFIKIFQK